ncbi:MAG: tRNA wybutosine-synthesizing 3 family protein [Candidatus Woesearchaeota archaeon]
MNRFEDINKFLEEKKKILTKDDLSKKGSIDIEIKSLVEQINNNPDLCTTSSCAGRITLLERKSNKKIDSKWLYSSHQPVDPEIIIKHLESNNDVWLMQESCILHVFVRTFEAAERFLKACRQVGFKRSGITAISGRIMIETMGNEKVEALLIKNGNKIVDDNYVKIIIKESNDRMLKNRAKMDKLLEVIQFDKSKK